MFIDFSAYDFSDGLRECHFFPFVCSSCNEKGVLAFDFNIKKEQIPSDLLCDSCIDKRYLTKDKDEN